MNLPQPTKESPKESFKDSGREKYKDSRRDDFRKGKRDRNGKSNIVSTKEVRLFLNVGKKEKSVPEIYLAHWLANQVCLAILSAISICTIAIHLLTSPVITPIRLLIPSPVVI